jgi:SAM-dependent methyltransferase
MAFEGRGSVDTSVRIPLDELGLTAPERHEYRPAGWQALGRALQGMPVGRGDVFIDIGAGLGRVVVQAARRPFDRVIGLELSEELTDRAQRYVDEHRSKLRAPVELVCGDASTFRFPDDVTVVFLNNPFEGDLLRRCVANLVASLDRRPRQLLVLYVNARDVGAFTSTGRFEIVRERRRRRDDPTDAIVVLRAPGPPS